MKTIKLHCSHPIFDATIKLDGSKSISNRLVIINALSSNPGELNHCSTSMDTQVLQEILQQYSTLNVVATDETYDVGHAGTSFRFLTAFFSTQPGTQILTGSERMKQRPIGPLVEALVSLGADITYAENEGFPPLIIKESSKAWKDKISISASISSQFISALLLIAPILPNGLEIKLIGKQVSLPYILMTTDIMKQCGIAIDWSTDVITVSPGEYKLSSFDVESDWSAASYYYSIAAFSEQADIKLEGLQENSLQSDKAIAVISEQFGVVTKYEPDGIRILKEKDNDYKLSPVFEYNFLKCPDIAQTVMTIVAGLGIQGVYTGLETLKIKETDRFVAMKTELEKVAVFLTALPIRFSERSEKQYYLSEGKAVTTISTRFDSYNDHRMAMSLAALSVLFDIEINEPSVVKKSYGSYWKDLEKLGISHEEIG